jgi:hypothetical protein
MTTVNSVGVSLSGQSGTGAFAGTTSPTFVTPALGTPSSGNLANCTGYPSEPIWAANSNSSISAAVNTGYVLTSGSATTVTLPTTFAVGNIIGVAGQGAAWTVDVGAATNVKAFGNTYTTSLASTNNSDTLVLIGVVANTTWGILSMTSTGLTAS